VKKQGQWLALALLLVAGCSAAGGGAKLPGDELGGNDVATELTADGAAEMSSDALLPDYWIEDWSDGPGNEPDGLPPGPDLCAGCQCDDSCGLETVGPDGEVAGPFCGDGVCDAGESWLDCLSDCPNPCGDGACGPTEECETCPQDCGACPGTAFCNLSGKAGDEVSCPVDLAASGPDSVKAVGLQFKLGFDAASVEFVKFHDELCTDGNNCMSWDIPPQAIVMPTGHALAYNVLTDGLIKVILYHASDPLKPLSDAWMSQGLVQGDPWLFDIVFKLKQDLEPGTGEASVDELIATDADANPLTVEVDGNLLITQ